MKRPGFLMIALALAALFFGWRTYRAWTGPAYGIPPPPSAPAVPPIGISPEDPPQAVELSAPVAYITARPVFRPDRRPFQENASIVPARNYDQELSRFTLLGVLLLGDMKKAVVTGKSPGRPERYELSPGETLPGFVVKEIQQDGVLLEADGKEFLLPLYAGAPKVQGTGGLRTDLPSTQASPASAGQTRPPPAPIRADSVSAPARTGSAGAVPAKTQAPASVAPPGLTGSPAEAFQQRPYRGRVRPTYVPGQR
ncbi:MAG: hypothetical protein HY896_10475 [Deltaproteobacteria bacterium]|nr:hypothetical protein [Deltaproteobacteria bacterium]